MLLKHFSLYMVLIFSTTIVKAKEKIVPTIKSLKMELQNLEHEPTSEAYLTLLHDLAKAYEKEGNYQESRNLCNKGMGLSAQNTSREMYFKLALQKAKTCYFLSDYVCAREVYEIALGVNEDFVQPKDSARIFSQLGYVYYHTGNLEEALAYHLKALKIYEVLEDPFLIAQFYFAEGLIFFEQKKFEEALASYKKSLGIYQTSGETRGLSDWYSVLGEAYHELDSLEQALHYKKEAFKIDSLNNYQYGLGYDYYSLALTYTKLKKYDLAMQLHQKGLKIREKIGDQEEIAKSYAAIGMLYLELDKSKTAEINLLKALNIAKSINTKLLVKDVYQQLSKVYEKIGNFKDAFHYQQRYFLLKDSLINEETLQSINALKSTYQLEQQEQQINLLQKDKEVKNLYLNLGFFSIVFLLVVGGFRYRAFQKKSRYTQILKEKNKEIYKQNQQLKNANDDLEQFAYISSHDLKAPLRIIGSYAGLLKRRYRDTLDDAGKEFLDFIVTGVTQMNTLLEDIYTYTRLEKTADNFVPIELDKTVEKTLFNLRQVIEDKQATVNYSNLPIVLGNSTLLGQVFQNLIDNALKFIPADRKPVIQIESKLEKGCLNIAIKDNGIGIAPEFHEQIFTVFRRLHNNTEFQGTGVGLAICKKIVERHHGKIWVESDGKNGTTFWISLPKSNLG